MTEQIYDSERSPKGDHNRRIALGLSREDFAVRAGLAVEALREYETTGPDNNFDLDVAHQVGMALERLEAASEQPSTNPPPTQP